MYNLSFPQSILTHFSESSTIKCPKICGILSMGPGSLEFLSTSQVDKNGMRLKVMFPRNPHFFRSS